MPSKTDNNNQKHTKRCIFLWKFIKSHNKTQRGFMECDCQCHVFPNNFRSKKA